jgi:hypothetical protein
MRIAISHSFLEAVLDLSPADTRRAAAFLDKLLHSTASAGLRPERVHDATDPSIRSYKVTRDLRAIGRTDGDLITVLYVAQHDEAYRWARDRCSDCPPTVRDIDVVEDQSPRVCSDSKELCSALEAAGLEHGLLER